MKERETLRGAKHPLPFGGVHGEAEPSNCEANPFGCTIFFVKKGTPKGFEGA